MANGATKRIRILKPGEHPSLLGGPPQVVTAEMVAQAVANFSRVNVPRAVRSDPTHSVFKKFFDPSAPSVSPDNARALGQIKALEDVEGDLFAEMDADLADRIDGHCSPELIPTEHGWDLVGLVETPYPAQGGLAIAASANTTTAFAAFAASLSIQPAAPAKQENPMALLLSADAAKAIGLQPEASPESVSGAVIALSANLKAKTDEVLALSIDLSKAKAELTQQGAELAKAKTEREALDAKLREAEAMALSARTEARIDRLVSENRVGPADARNPEKIYLTLAASLPDADWAKFADAIPATKTIPTGGLRAGGSDPNKDGAMGLSSLADVNAEYTRAVNDPKFLPDVPVNSPDRRYLVLSARPDLVAAQKRFQSNGAAVNLT